MCSQFQSTRVHPQVFIGSLLVIVAFLFVHIDHCLSSYKCSIFTILSCFFPPFYFSGENKQYDILNFLLISEIMEYTVDCTLFLSSFCSRFLGICAVGFQFVSLFVHMLYYCRDDILTSFSNIYYIKQACNPLLYLSRKTLSFGRSS